MFKKRQAKTNARSIETFSDRLLQAFNTSEIAEIAKRLDKSYTTIKNYIINERLPETAILLKISQATGCSVHWLLTGKGEKFVNKNIEISFDQIFEQKIRRIVREELEQSQSIEERVKKVDLPVAGSVGGKPEQSDALLGDEEQGKTA